MLVPSNFGHHFLLRTAALAAAQQQSNRQSSTRSATPSAPLASVPCESATDRPASADWYAQQMPCLW
jgi:hypothetical protein